MLKFKCALWLFWSRIVLSREFVPISPLLSRKTEAKRSVDELETKN